jgi:hypothetical protein
MTRLRKSVTVVTARQHESLVNQTLYSSIQVSKRQFSVLNEFKRKLIQFRCLSSNTKLGTSLTYQKSSRWLGFWLGSFLFLYRKMNEILIQYLIIVNILS